MISLDVSRIEDGWQAAIVSHGRRIASVRQRMDAGYGGFDVALEGGAWCPVNFANWGDAIGWAYYLPFADDATAALDRIAVPQQAPLGGQAPARGSRAPPRSAF